MSVENTGQGIVRKARLEIDCQSKSAASQSAVLSAASRLKGEKTVSCTDAGCILEVQYNPASIRYTGNASERETEIENVPADGTDGVMAIVKTSVITMSFSLVFYSMEQTDISVQEQMERMIQMIYNSPTRHVKFSWADMTFEGRLVSFTGSYDMFDRTGRPVSGHMDLSLTTQLQASVMKKVMKNMGKERRKPERNNY